jgi:omega-amidase
MKKIALAQINIEYGSFEINVSVMENYLSSACELHCDLVMMPELWSTGFDLHNIADYPKKNHDLLAHFQSIADQKHISICGSLITKDGFLFHNSFYYLHPHRVEFIYQKKHLFALMHEDRYFAPGTHSYPFESVLGSSAAAICYDLRFPEHFSSLTAQGVEFFLLSAHWPLARIQHWDVLLQARAIENQAFLIAVNSVGKSGKDVYGGHSMVIAPDGEILLQCPDDQDGLFTVEIDPVKPAKVRKDFPMKR